MGILPDYKKDQRDFIDDLKQWSFQRSIPEDDKLNAWRAIVAITGSDGVSGVATPVRVTEDGELVTTAVLSAENISVSLDFSDGLNKYGEISGLAPSTSGDIVIINVPANKKINLMGYSAEGSGLGDYKIIVDDIVQTRKIKRKQLEGNFGFYGIGFNGPAIVSLNVTNIETVLTTSCKNKNHTYFGNIYYNLKDV